MTTLGWVGIGFVVLIAGAIAEAIFKKNRSQTLSSMRPIDHNLRSQGSKPDLGMEAIDRDIVDQTVRENRRIEEMNSAIMGQRPARRWFRK